MARDEELSSGASSRSNDELDRYFGHSHPNPDRVGCLSAEHLRALARKERDISDPGYEHLEQCSPCYRQFRTFQQTLGTTRRYRLLAAAAMIAVIVSGAAVYLTSEKPNDARSAIGRKDPVTSRAVLDLRAFIVTRGEQEPRGVQPLLLPRAELTVDILLPVGFEPGTYDLRLVDQNLQTVLNQQVTSTMKDQITTIHTRMNLRNVPPGAYQLAVRHPGEEWHLYPAKLD